MVWLKSIDFENIYQNRLDQLSLGILQYSEMDSLRGVLDKVKFPNSVDDFVKSDTQSKVVVIGVASKNLPEIAQWFDLFLIVSFWFY